MCLGTSWSCEELLEGQHVPHYSKQSESQTFVHDVGYTLQGALSSAVALLPSQLPAEHGNLGYSEFRDADKTMEGDASNAKPQRYNTEFGNWKLAPSCKTCRNNGR